jgi:hypothetical protein
MKRRTSQGQAMRSIFRTLARDPARGPLAGDAQVGAAWDLRQRRRAPGGDVLQAIDAVLAAFDATLQVAGVQPAARSLPRPRGRWPVDAVDDTSRGAAAAMPTSSGAQ